MFRPDDTVLNAALDRLIKAEKDASFWKGVIEACKQLKYKSQFNPNGKRGRREWTDEQRQAQSKRAKIEVAIQDNTEKG